MINPPWGDQVPAGVLPGLWPTAPDAPLVVPVSGSCSFKGYDRGDLRRVDPPLSPAFVLTRDAYRVGATRMDMLVASRQWAPFGEMSLAILTFVQAGEISGLSKPLRWRVTPETAAEFVETVTIGNGPAVWLRTPRLEWVIPTPDPCRLASEIERRRSRTVRLGGPDTAKVWKIAPQLRVQDEDGFRPAGPGDDRAAPSFLAKYGGTWTPLPTAPVDRDAPAPFVATSPVPLTGVPYPESLGDVVLPLSEGTPALVLNVSNHRIRLSQQPLMAAADPFRDPDEILETGPPRWGSRPYLSAPAAEFPVIRAGTLSGVPDGWSIRTLAPDALTEIRIDIADGPAVWLWGMTTEWLIPTPYAEQVAADLRLRRRVASLYPLIGKYSPESAVWNSYPDMELVETEQGWCLPPTPPYAPSEPTIVPPGTWRAGPN